MGRTKDMKPWTWEEIFKLKGKARTAFLRAYGDRARVALTVAYCISPERHKPGSRMPCAGTIREKAEWGMCPFYESRWRRHDDPLSCVDRSPLVYARMVVELGLLPEGM
jgi:hypothetical protein